MAEHAKCKCGDTTLMELIETTGMCMKCYLKNKNKGGTNANVNKRQTVKS